MLFLALMFFVKVKCALKNNYIKSIGNSNDSNKKIKVEEGTSLFAEN